MPCIPNPIPTPPPLPVPPFGIPALPIPPIPAEPELCCQLPDIASLILAHAPPIPLPPGTINPAAAQAIVAIIEEGIDAVMTYIDAIPLECPRV